MRNRHRVTFRTSPSSDTDAATPETVDLETPPGRPPPPPTRHRSGRHRRVVLVVAAMALVSTAAAAIIVAGDDAPPEAVEVDEFTGTGISADQRVFIRASEVLAPPLRGTVNRYWASVDDTMTDRAHVFTIGVTDPGAWGDPAPSAVVVADATRRARVPESGAVASPGGIPVRVLTGVEGRHLVLEWDTEGWGFSVISTSVSLEAALRIVDAVRIPVGDSLLSGRPPGLDHAVLAADGLVQTSLESAPAAIAGAPLVGQAGLDAVEAYVYRPDSSGPASFVLSATVSPVLRARHLSEALGHGITLDAPWSTTGAAVGLDLTTDAPVAFRITGSSRLLFDHPSGTTFWVASDQLTVQQLIDAASGVDFDRIALRLTRT